MPSSALTHRLTICAGGVVAVGAGLFCYLAPAAQLAIASRILFATAGLGAFLASVAIFALRRRTKPGWDGRYGGDPKDGPEPFDPTDPFDLELRDLLRQEGVWR